MVKAVLREQVEARPCPHAASAPPALHGVGLADPHLLQGGDALLCLVAQLLHAARVNHKNAVVDRDGRFRNVGGQNHLDLALGRGRENLAWDKREVTEGKDGR